MADIQGQVTENPIYPRPTQVPRPVSVAGVENPVLSLNGQWKRKVKPEGTFWRNETDFSSWDDVRVPGARSNDGLRELTAYKTTFTVPEGYKGKRIILRFESVSGQAKVWIDGKPVREHWGTFMPWTCDITPYVTAGRQAQLTLSVDDRKTGLAEAVSGGGITRDVRLMAVPQDYLTRLHVDTNLDSTYTDATLNVWVTMAFNKARKAVVEFVLKDCSGKEVPLVPSTTELTFRNRDVRVSIPIKAPLKWDAEHPNLYRLEARLMQDGKVQQVLVRNVGFRELERVGNQVFVNGKEVKLRGLWEVSDVARMRAANINHTRRKWATEEFLDACDSLGMYVLDEVPIDFIWNSSRDDDRYSHQYLSMTADLMERDRSHPSVIIWGMGNESFYGSNVDKTLKYADAEDPGRLTFFSWGNRPQRAGEEPPFSVYSGHYYNWDEPIGRPHMRFNRDIPVLHDEYAHIAWYNKDMMRTDPNMHNFWGESIYRFWENIFHTKGALGGDIFAFRYFDDPREEKPEYWLMKKAYSPVRIDEKRIYKVDDRQQLIIPVKNWFDHTRLDELRMEWACGEASGTVIPPAIEPHSEGVLTLPLREPGDQEYVTLNVYDRNDLLVDAYKLRITPLVTELSPFRGPAPRVEDRDGQLVVSGKDFSVSFDKATGLIADGSYKGVQVIKGGPYLHLAGSPLLYQTGGLLQGWEGESINYATEKDKVVVTVKGKAGKKVKMTYRIHIDSEGLIATGYTFDPVMTMVPPMVCNSQMRDVGGFKEIGVSFLLTDAVDRLSWKRDGLWSVYPEGHVGRNEGTAYRTAHRSDKSSWAEVERDTWLFGRYDAGRRGTRDFRSLKEHIYFATALVGESGVGLRAESSGEDAVRLEVVPDKETMVDDRDRRLQYSGTWMDSREQAGAYGETVTESRMDGAQVELTFEGQGIEWLGKPGTTRGTADVYIDGKLEVAGLSLNRTEEQRYLDKQPLALFSKEGLSDGKHTLKIVARSSDVAIDVFRLLRSDSKDDVRMVYVNQWNYPDLSWGNYVKRPQITGNYYQNAVRMRLIDVIDTHR